MPGALYVLGLNIINVSFLIAMPRLVSHRLQKISLINQFMLIMCYKQWANLHISTSAVNKKISVFTTGKVNALSVLTTKFPMTVKSDKCLDVYCNIFNRKEIDWSLPITAENSFE